MRVRVHVERVVRDHGPHVGSADAVADDLARRLRLGLAGDPRRGEALAQAVREAVAGPERGGGRPGA